MGDPSFSLFKPTPSGHRRKLLLFHKTQESSWSTSPPLKVFKFSLSPRFHCREVFPVIGILKVVGLMFGFTFALIFREQPKTSKRTVNIMGWVGRWWEGAWGLIQCVILSFSFPIPAVLVGLRLWNPSSGSCQRHGDGREEGWDEDPSLLNYPLHQTSLHLRVTGMPVASQPHQKRRPEGQKGSIVPVVFIKRTHQSFNGLSWEL